MAELGAEIIRVEGDYEKAVAVSQEQAREKELKNPLPGDRYAVILTGRKS